MGRTIHRARAVATLALVGVLVIGCGLESAAPGPDVEGTVQARVSATVQALARTSPSTSGLATATRPLGTATVATGTTGTPLATAAGSATALSGTPAPGATVAPANATASAGVGLAASATALVGAATRLAGSPAVGTPSPVGTGAATSVAALGATPTATLSFGGVAQLSGVAVTLTRYEWGYACPAAGDAGTPGAGWKFVTVYAGERGVGPEGANAPAVQWTLEGFPAESGAQSGCRQDEQALLVACRPGSRLTADARCEGWVVFRVPDALPLANAVVRAQAGGAAQWRIPATA